MHAFEIRTTLSIVFVCTSIDVVHHVNAIVLFLKVAEVSKLKDENAQLMQQVKSLEELGTWTHG